MDPNEYVKGLIQQYAPQVQQGLGMAGAAAQHGLGLMSQDAQTAAGYMNDPRMAGIGMGPEAAVAGKGLGLMAGVLRGIGGSREALNPLLLQAWKRGEELSKMQDAVRKTPDVFGFTSPSAWRKSLPDHDQFSMWMYENTAKKLASREVRNQGLIEQNIPTEEALSDLQASKQFPPGESDAVYALGLDRMKLARERSQN